MTAYVNEVFSEERRIAASLPRGGGSPARFERDIRLGGFTAAVLLDRRGLVQLASPDDPALSGVDLASQYPHLSAALAGEATVSEVVLSAAEQTPIVAFALPLANGDAGVLSAGFSLEESPLSKVPGGVADSRHSGLHRRHRRYSRSVRR
ncbi:MAG: PDC sensor domain-containing protein [Actinomycetota bacterium]|nr:PDC sensor domain-containing protein [Actinomycetota bacterium]